MHLSFQLLLRIPVPVDDLEYEICGKNGKNLPFLRRNPDLVVWKDPHNFSRKGSELFFRCNDHTTEQTLRFSK